MNDNAKQVMDKLEGLYLESAELRSRLRQALAIQDLWPEAFMHGKAKTTWRRTPVKGGYREILVITDGSGQRRSFPESDVPAEIKRPWLLRAAA
jgi:hypothetical protein